MKVYTYYEDLRFDSQNELIEIWKLSWKIKGFSPKILSRTDSENHPLYKQYSNFIKNVVQELSGTPPTKYGLACWFRWLAYSTQPEEDFYVTDYDVINHNFAPIKPEEGLCMLDHACPCIASGKPQDFEKLCSFIMTIITDNKQFFKENYKILQTDWFNDQEFFQIVNKLNPNLIKMTRNRESFLSTPIMQEFWKRPLVHYGGGLCDKYLKSINKKYTPTTRIELIKHSLNRSK